MSRGEAVCLVKLNLAWSRWKQTRIKTYSKHSNNHGSPTKLSYLSAEITLTD